LKGADYAGQPWLREAEIKGRYISNVFLGLRDFPHMVMAVHRLEADGTRWTLRVTIDISQLERSLVPVGPEMGTDIFLCDNAGVLQTSSRLYGKALDTLPLTLPPAGLEPTISRLHDAEGRQLLIATALLAGTDLRLVAVKPGIEAMRPWTSLRTELLLVLCGGIVIIMLVSHMLMKSLVGRMQAADEHRAAIFAQMEHQQKLSSIGRLAAGVAHEVNNPLAIIYEKAGLALDMLRMQKGAVPEEQQARLLSLLEGIESTVERARNITHRLLGFSRRMEASHQPLYLTDVIRESMEFLEREAASRGVQMSVRLPDNLPQIVSDRGQLQQVFLNVLGNALDALNDQKENGRIEVDGKQADNGTIIISVRDNGKGMPPDMLRHIFEPFYSSKKDKGTGLGMFITYAIVRRLGGDIEVQSREDLGTTVHIRLPLNPSEHTVEVA
ncbi:MAG: ATP-binding protein, partial [Desulfovibrionaceae bacterium]|nr:ATP-binding protein [Desulfovibrionaceae bacterium]